MVYVYVYFGLNGYSMLEHIFGDRSVRPVFLLCY